MKKITMYSQTNASVQEYFRQYLISGSARGLSEATLKTYQGHFNSLSKFLDMSVLLSSLTKADVERAVVSMRKKELSQNSVASYMNLRHLSAGVIQRVSANSHFQTSSPMKRSRRLIPIRSYQHFLKSPPLNVLS